MYSVNWKSISAHNIRVPLIYISYHAENLSISIREGARERENKKAVRRRPTNLGKKTKHSPAGETSVTGEMRLHQILASCMNN